MRRREEHILRRALSFDAGGRRPPERPKKTWRRVVEEDMRMLNVTEEMAVDRQQWRRLIVKRKIMEGENKRNEKKNGSKEGRTEK